jgi:hypothetical protein
LFNKAAVGEEVCVLMELHEMKGWMSHDAL